jgi:chemosensory pili system protein ChpA (sensor histidine kinase/response regulator)
LVSAIVMVVDDSMTMRRVTQTLLERNGMQVITARDGLEAVLLLREGPRPHVILLDIGMPGMDGYEVANQVRNDLKLKDVPIIMMSGSPFGEKHRARAVELGIKEYLHKPYTQAELLKAILPLIEHLSGGDEG